MPDSKTMPSLSAPKAAAYSPSFAKPAAPAPVAAKREAFIGFARDEESANTLHEALAGYLPNNNLVHVVDFRGSLAILAAMTTPEIILVDLSGEDQPMNAMMDLADVVEPGTIVLAIGEIHTVSFYRTVTKGMGIREYLSKPLTRALVEQNFLPLIANKNQNNTTLRGGRMIALAGARGGVGTTTIATNLAWYTATELHRHTVLLDGELNTGTVALNLDLRVDNGLIAALETPERVDHLLLERSTHEAAERLHVLAGLGELTQPVGCTHEGAANFLQTLRTRYNYVVADAGARLEPFSRDILFNAQQRIIVMDPSMISMRNLERLLSLPGGSSQSPHVLVVLNKAGAPGGLTQAYMEQAMGLRFDAVIPDLPRIVPRTTQLGTQAAALRGAFRNGIATLAGVLGATTPQAAEAQRRIARTD
jgi:pilus assembly protein CpaE